MTETFDIVVVGASIAGCTAARLYGQAGARVALVERRPDPDAYKVACTHFIQAGASPVIERLGLVPELLAAGAVPGRLRLWTRYGWIEPPTQAVHGWSIARSSLDPILRRAAVGLPEVTYLPGRTAVGLHETEGRIDGVRVRARDGSERELRAPLVVAADGRASGLARLARVPARVRPNERFGYFAYFRGIDVGEERRGHMWLSDPDVAYVFPCGDDLACVAVMQPRAQLPAFRADVDASFARAFDELPEAPDVRGAQRISKWIGKVDTPNAERPPVARGMAFAGDAATASDPLWGVGCGWAFRAAEWLVDETVGALGGGPEALDRALEGYRRRHRSGIRLHHFLNADYSSGRGFSPIDRLVYGAAAHSPRVAARMEGYGTGRLSPQAFLSPVSLGQMAAVRTRAALRGA